MPATPHRQAFQPRNSLRGHRIARRDADRLRDAGEETLTIRLRRAGAGPQKHHIPGSELQLQMQCSRRLHWRTPMSGMTRNEFLRVSGTAAFSMALAPILPIAGQAS